ncbi:hypothetical protein EMO91_12605, partial [Bifidobacterium myosotis]
MGRLRFYTNGVSGFAGFATRRWKPVVATVWAVLRAPDLRLFVCSCRLFICCRWAVRVSSLCWLGLGLLVWWWFENSRACLYYFFIV